MALDRKYAATVTPGPGLLRDSGFGVDVPVHCILEDL